ncbi:MAG: zinc-dependent alcohol dehydrogenase [Thermoplasmata archaeon]
MGEKAVKRRSLYFKGERKVSVKEETVSKPEGKEVLVETLCSGVSRGTELLLYRDKIEKGICLDKSWDYKKNSSQDGFKYGYSCVGRIISTGDKVSEKMEGKKVFAFNPHESHFLADFNELVLLDENIDAENSIFLPTLETAVNFALDSTPVIGERCAVFGQGTVGLLTTYVLDHFPLENIITSDRYEKKKYLSEKMGADTVFDAKTPAVDMLERCGLNEDGFDLSLELTGYLEVLQKAVDILGFGGRVVVGSWYGNRGGELTLGTDFHRGQIEIKSSQVSSIPKERCERWDKERRIETTLEFLRKDDFTELISHEYDIDQASKAFEKLEKEPGEVVQLIFRY